MCVREKEERQRDSVQLGIPINDVVAIYPSRKSSVKLHMFICVVCLLSRSSSREDYRRFDIVQNIV